MGRPLLLLPWATLIDSHFFVSATAGRRVLADETRSLTLSPGKSGLAPAPQSAREGKTWEPGERIGGRGGSREEGDGTTLRESSCSSSRGRSTKVWDRPREKRGYLNSIRERRYEDEIFTFLKSESVVCSACKLASHTRVYTLYVDTHMGVLAHCRVCGLVWV